MKPVSQPPAETPNHRPSIFLQLPAQCIITGRVQSQWISPKIL